MMKRYVLWGLLAIVGVLAILVGLLAATLYEASKTARTDGTSTATTARTYSASTAITTASSNAAVLLIYPKIANSFHAILFICQSFIDQREYPQLGNDA